MRWLAALLLLLPGCVDLGEPAEGPPRWVLVAAAFGSPEGTVVDLGLLDEGALDRPEDARLQPVARVEDIVLTLTRASGVRESHAFVEPLAPEEGETFVTLRVHGSSWRNLTANATFVLPNGARVTPTETRATASPAWRARGTVVEEARGTTVLTEVFERRPGARGYVFTVDGTGSIARLAFEKQDVLAWAAEGVLPTGERVRNDTWSFMGEAGIGVVLPAGAEDVALDFEVRLANGRTVTDEDADVALERRPGGARPPT